jgi:thioredoxin reductase
LARLVTDEIGVPVKACAAVADDSLGYTGGERERLEDAVEKYDTVVVGGGPAGLSGALVLGRCVRKVLVCDSGRYRNERSLALHCYMGHDGIAPADLLAHSRRQLERYRSVSLTKVTVANLVRDENAFTVHFEAADPVRARSVLVASGVVDEIPRIDGIAELYGRSIHVCPYCDGWEHRDAPVVVYGKGEKGASLALLLRQWTNDLVLCTDGPGEISKEDRTRLDARSIILDERPIASLEGVDGCLKAVNFRDGTHRVRQAMFFNTGQHQRSPLLARLGCRFEDDGGVACDENGATSVPGIYVAGDVSRDVQLVIVAAAEGAKAALAINTALLRGAGHL